MKAKRWAAAMSAAILITGVIAGCGSSNSPAPGKGTAATESNEPYPISLAIQQVGDIPEANSDVQKELEKYSNTKLTFQWIPNSNYDEKVNVMMASGELPKMLKVKLNPTVTAALQSGQFWEIGPYLKDYPNLSMMRAHFENIAVDGKIFGIPNFRELARGGIVYRKDWFDAMGLKVPTNVDEWYNVIKALTLNDPDKNGKNDTYGIMLNKEYNGSGPATQLNRLAVNMGGPNKWAVDGSGKFTPDFLTAPYMDVLKLFRRLYAEKLLNQDFSVLDDQERLKVYDAGRVGIRITVTGDAKGMQDRAVKNAPTANYDVAPLTGPQGIRVPAELGNNGMVIMSKSAVKTEADLKKVLKFADKVMDEQMSMLLLRGFEGKHHKKTPDGKQTEMIDPDLFSREVKPYRDNLFHMEGANIMPSKDTPLGAKQTKLTQENVKYAVQNPALTLSSATYSEKGKQLETIMSDAETKYIMGKIDDAGFQEEIAKWRKQGGDQLIKEYEAAYAKSKK